MCEKNYEFKQEKNVLCTVFGRSGKRRKEKDLVSFKCDHGQYVISKMNKKLKYQKKKNRFSISYTLLNSQSGDIYFPNFISFDA